MGTRLQQIGKLMTCAVSGGHPERAHAHQMLTVFPFTTTSKLVRIALEVHRVISSGVNVRVYIRAQFRGMLPRVEWRSRAWT
jgi:hypothetical protein